MQSDSTHGYQPESSLDQETPPQGGSGVPLVTAPSGAYTIKFHDAPPGYIPMIVFNAQGQEIFRIDPNGDITSYGEVIGNNPELAGILGTKYPESSVHHTPQRTGGCGCDTPW